MSNIERVNYLAVTVTHKAHTDSAVLVAYNDDELWLPRSLLGLLSDNKIDNAQRGDELKLYLPDWKVRQLGWE